MQIHDYFSGALRQTFGLMPLHEAVIQMHYPTTKEGYDQANDID